MQRSHVVFLISALAAALPAHAAETLFVQVPAVFDTNARVPSNIRRECGVDTLLGNQALARISARIGNVQAVDKPEQAGGANLLVLTITSADGFGGGGWSGPKSLSIRADLMQNGVALGTTNLIRSSKGGMFGGFKGTCAIFDRITETLGNDVSKWLVRGARAQAAADAADDDEPATGK